MGYSPITLYAVFQKSVTVTKYNGSNTASTESKNIYYNNGNAANPSFTLSENAVSGWTKAGWTNSDSGYSATVADGGSVTLSANATYYSLYTLSITVTYYNNSTTASTTSKNRVANYHSTTTYSNPTFNLTEATVSSWNARGWSTSNTGNASITYNNATNFTRDSNVTLYSLYQRTVTVSYNANSGSGTTQATTGTAYRNASGTTINASLTVANNGFTRSQYAFDTWAAGSASGTKYAPGSTYSSTSDVTMYAVWMNYTYLKKFTIASTATSFTVTKG